MHILNLEEFCLLDAYLASILYTPFYATKSFAITHIDVQFCVLVHALVHLCVLYCLCVASVLVLVFIYMSVLESPTHHSIRIDQDQTYSIGSPDLREDALDDVLCRICLQCDDSDILEQEAERNQL